MGVNNLLMSGIQDFETISINFVYLIKLEAVTFEIISLSPMLEKNNFSLSNTGYPPKKMCTFFNS